MDAVGLYIESFRVLHKGPILPTKCQRALWADLEGGTGGNAVRDRLAEGGGLQRRFQAASPPAIRSGGPRKPSVK
eukprot:8521362-Pyramimonas_sp.AAC.1